MLLAAVLAAGCTAGCAAGPAAPFRATAGTCYAFAVLAVQRHVTVARLPRACAGLSHEQIDQALARAIHAAAGLGPKAAARRRAYRDSRYLARLFRAVAPPRAVSGPAPLAGAAGRAAGPGLRLAALASWVVTAAAGAYLLAGWLVRGRRDGAAGRPPVIVVGHAAAALAGLGIWLAFVASHVPALAWTGAGLIIPAAGLGMATLVGALPGPAPSAGPASPGPLLAARPAETAAPARVRIPVAVIALHGMLATATILLVLLAAIGAG